MLKLMDYDKDREISWREFHTFISYKASANRGQALLLGMEFCNPIQLSGA